MRWSGSTWRRLCIPAERKKEQELEAKVSVMSAKSRLNVLFMIVYLNKSEVRTYESSGTGHPPKSTLAKIRASRDISPFTHAMDKLPL
jgi:hypothetical protein